MTVGNRCAPLSGPVTGSHPAGESLQGLWRDPSRLGVSIAAARMFRMEASEPSGCATLAAEDGYPLQPQDFFEISFASPGFFSGGFRESSSKPGTLTNTCIETVDGKGVGGSLTGQGANITPSSGAAGQFQ